MAQPGICETTPGVKSYAGYVQLPPGILADTGVTQDYPINTFFWFFESRINPREAPLAIWINGGPGSSSLLGLFSGNGPCSVKQDSNSTILNAWSWNNAVNMLYFEQPVQTGLSYDSLHNGTLNLTTGGVTLLQPGDPIPEQVLWNTLVGTFSSNNRTNTANTTANAARAAWHFAQTWFQEFPEYMPNNKKISLFTESYGGHYGPAFAKFFEEQNARIKNGSWHEKGDMFEIHLDTLGIVNGCIDWIAQTLSYISMYVNNTYGLVLASQAQIQAELDQYYQPNGCLEQLQACIAAAAEGDPNGFGDNQTVISLCEEVQCEAGNTYYSSSGRSPYDLSQPTYAPFPPRHYLGFLNQPHVQQALGTPLNYSDISLFVNTAFSLGGDIRREPPNGGYLADIGALLDSGIKVALMYGDRDYACNWIGGENASLNVPYSKQQHFLKAGYASINTYGLGIGGLVRQHGNFSFSRVFEAGHNVAAYQPATAYQIFMRAILGRDIATGTIDVARQPGYSTAGPESITSFREALPPAPPPQCYVLSTPPLLTCTPTQREMVQNGSGLVHDFVLVGPNPGEHLRGP